MEVQRLACHHNGALNPKFHRTDQHPHSPHLCLLTAGCAPNAKSNLLDLNYQCRLSDAGIHVQNMSGRQICKTPGLNRLPRLTGPPPCSSRRPGNSETLTLTGTPYHLTHVCTAVPLRVVGQWSGGVALSRTYDRHTNSSRFLSVHVTTARYWQTKIVLTESVHP